MKYLYAYKTSDGMRHEASMDAESREDVFSALRAQGIKAIKVTASDGSKANGEVRGVRKRVVVTVAAFSVVVAIASIVLSVLWFRRELTNRSADEGRSKVGEMVAASPLPRQMVSGDRRRVELAGRVAFTNRVESLLARFAEPGRPFDPPGDADCPNKEDVDQAFKTPVYISSGEFTESVDIKRIVVGLKHEMRDYVMAGGSVGGFISALVKRQQTEISYRMRAELKLKQLVSAIKEDKVKLLQDGDEDLAMKTAYEYWLRANAQLLSMGIFPIPLPDRLAKYQLSVDIDL